MMACFKRIYILLPFLLALPWACRRNAVPPAPPVEDDHQSQVSISFVAGDGSLTKVANAVSDIGTLRSGGFKVSAFYGGGYGTPPRWLSAPAFWQVRYRGTASYFQPDPVRFWPDTGRVDFYASFPDDIVIDANKPTVGITDCNHDFIAARNCAVVCQNVIGDGDDTGFVPVTFKHPLCFLYDIMAKMVIDNDDPYLAGDAANLSLRIDGIEAVGPDESTFRFNMESTASTNQEAVLVGNFDAPSGSGTFSVRNTALAGVGQDGLKSIIENQFFFIPGGEYVFTVSYSLMLRREGGLPDLAVMSYRKKFTLPAVFWDGLSERPSDANSKLLSGCMNTIALGLPADSDKEIVFHVVFESFSDFDFDELGEDGGTPKDPWHHFEDDDFEDLDFSGEKE